MFVLDFNVELVEMDGETGGVHLLINYPPKLAISNLVNSLKGVSSRLLGRDRPDIAQRDYYKGGSLVAELFHGELWWRTNIHYPPVH